MLFQASCMPFWLSFHQQTIKTFFFYIAEDSILSDNTFYQYPEQINSFHTFANKLLGLIL